MNTQAQLERQNERLQLLLNLTTRITSNLDLREVFRAIAANIREVIHGDAVAVSLPDQTSGKSRIFAMDFPHGKGILKEELLFTPSGAVKQVLDTLKPVVIGLRFGIKATSGRLCTRYRQLLQSIGRVNW